MPTRKYFTKAVTPVPRLPRPDHVGKVVQWMEGGVSRLVPAGYAARLQGNSKGGQTAQARGTAHKWTSAEARKAALKVWRTRWKLHKRIHKHIGRRADMRTRINRVILRAQYAQHPKGGITYCGWSHAISVHWWSLRDSLGDRRISERAALIRLGHLPSARKRIVPPGRTT